jgi:hypothetical protein
VTRTFQPWPDNPIWSFQVTRLLALADFGGSDFTEVSEVVQRITPRDVESWYREWLRTAQTVEAHGHAAEGRGNLVSAARFY